MVILPLHKKTVNNQESHPVTWDMATSKGQYTTKELYHMPD